MAWWVRPNRLKGPVTSTCADCWVVSVELVQAIENGPGTILVPVTAECAAPMELTLASPR